jgi:hypothetical protein
MGGQQNAVLIRGRRRPPLAEIAERWAALALAIAGVVVAIYALRIALRTDAAVSSTAKNLSTRYIGQFPEILPEIVTALQEAHKEISILSDVPGYAIYSSHNTYLNYEATLHQKAQYTAIRIAVLTPLRRRQMLQLQFGSQNFDILRQTDEYKAFRRWGGQDVDKIKNMSDFIDVLADAHGKKAAEFLPDMQVRQYDGEMPVYLWLVDDKVAVLSIPNLAPEHPKETAFITRDARLINQLSNVFNSYWSSPHTR